MNWRQVYLTASNPEAYFEESDISKWMAALAGPISHGGPLAAMSLQELGSWRRLEEEAFQEVSGEALQQLGRERAAHALLLHSSPLALVLGCWLQGMSAPGVFEDARHLNWLALLADDLGVGRRHGSRSDAFRMLLQRFNHPLQYLTPGSLPYEVGIEDAMFALPAVLLAMSRRSDVFHTELCAVDFVIRGLGLLPCWSMLSKVHPHSIDWMRLDMSRSGDKAIVADPHATSLALVQSCRNLGNAQAAVLDATTHWAFRALQDWSGGLRSLCSRAAGAPQAMAELLRQRSREAGVYHSGQSLEGCPLSAHLRAAARNPKPVLDVLSRSRYVRPGNAARSPLVNGLVSARGPMFRVFSPHELKMMGEWIDGLSGAASPTDSPPAAPGLGASSGPSQPSSWPDNASAGARPDSLRSAYYMLQGRALAPATRAFAVGYVRRWLRAASRARTSSDRALPCSWAGGTLQPWLLRQHDLHGKAFDESDRHAGSMPCREEVIESTLQLAPLILIDGAWLQGFTDVSLATSDVGTSLFEIYWDELGNGSIELNHPTIYRRLLRSMGVHLAPTGSWDFAKDSRLRDESFRLPVLWLCLGKLPRTFHAEVLGMNLAMELSGVGDGYREARRFLAYHGFSTQFVDLHNTIDNVATGHSAWAAVAIDKHMNAVAACGNARAVAQEWQRVRLGYAALTTKPYDFRERLKSIWRVLQGKPASFSAPPLPPLHHPTFPTV